MKTLLMLICIISLVFVAGCIDGGRTTIVMPNEGIVINSFITTPSITDLITGDTVIFDLELENVGGTTARNVQVQLYGVEDQWRDRDGSLVQSTLSKSIGTLKPPMQERNLPGDFRLAQWELMTPDIAQGLTVPLTVTARVTYDYNTSGFLQITAVNDEEYRRMQIEGSVPQSPVIQNSYGPIKLDVPTATEYQYIIVDTEEEEYTYPIRIVFTNVGQGFPLTGEGAGGRLTGTISLLGPGVEFDDCLGVTDGKTIDLDDTEIMLRLRDTNNVPVACTLKFNSELWEDRAMDSVILTFNLFYKYYTDEKVTVNVIGR